MAPRSSIIVPLYIYPEPGAWTILYQSIEKYSRVRFLIVINPGNGPGPSPLPDENYLREIRQLNSYENVTVLGYVHVSWCKRKLQEVLSDIETYANWRTHSQMAGLSVDGLFVDETPGEHDDAAEKYLREIKKLAKSQKGLGPDRTIIHNPGTIAHADLAKHADITVAFEDSLRSLSSQLAVGAFDQFRSGSSRFNFGRGADRKKQAKVAMIVHSVSPAMDASKRQDVVMQTREVADHLFVTDLDVDYYQSFSSNWLQWVDAIAQ